MDQIRRILVPTDFSSTAHNAFQYALAIAAQMKAEIHLLHVILPEMAPMDIPVPAAALMQRQTEAATEAIQAFQDYGLALASRAGLIETDPVIKSDVEVGTPVDVIRYVTAKANADMVIVGARGQHSIVDKILGSVSSGCLQQLSVPVMIIPEAAHYSGLSRVLIATDLGEQAFEQLADVGEMMKPFNSHYQLAHFNLASQNKFLSVSDMEATFDDLKTELSMEYILETIPDDLFSERLNQLLELHESDLLIMYSPHRRWFERLFHHSRTKEMIWETKVPLLRI